MKRSEMGAELRKHSGGRTKVLSASQREVYRAQLRQSTRNHWGAFRSVNHRHVRPLAYGARILPKFEGKEENR